MRRLRKEFIVISGPAITESKLQNSFSRADDGEALVWTPMDLDLTLAVYDGRNAVLHAFVCGYVVPTLLWIIQVSQRDLEKGLYTKIAAVPSQRRHYFTYLAVKSSLGTVSVTKKRDWYNILLTRKVEVMFQHQALLPIAKDEVKSDSVTARLKEQDRKISDIESRHHEEMKVLNQRLTEHSQLNNVLSDRQVNDSPELREEIKARQVRETKQIRGGFEWHRKAQDKFFHALREELMAGQHDYGKEIEDIRDAHDNDIRDVRKGQDDQDMEMQAMSKHQDDQDMEIKAITKHQENQATEIKDQAMEIKDVNKRQDDQETEIKDQGTEIKEVSNRQHEQGQELLATRKDFATTVDNTVARHSELMLTRMEQLLSLSNRPTLDMPVQGTPVEIDSPAGCTVQLYLQVCNPNTEAENEVDTGLLVLYRAFIEDEPTNAVVRAVTRGLSLSIPFIIALLGYSKGEKHSRSMSCWILY